MCPRRGKHNDLDEVGHTRRHGTFFEMLGNSSFGDCFKAEAIAYHWKLLTREFSLPADRLWITVFREDDDAEKIWAESIGVPRERIVRMYEADNFWQWAKPDHVVHVRKFTTTSDRVSVNSDTQIVRFHANAVVT